MESSHFSKKKKKERKKEKKIANEITKEIIRNNYRKEGESLPSEDNNKISICLKVSIHV